MLDNISNVNASNETNGAGSPTLVTYLIGSLLLVITLATIGGNVLVCLVILWYRHLRTVTNFFMVNLALADLLLGLCVMPLGVLDIFYDRWVFGPKVCYLWISLDVLCSSASIMNLVVISIDRFLKVSRPFEYGKKSYPRRSKSMMLLAWVLAAVISVLPVCLKLAEKVDPMKVVPERCIFIPNRYFATIGSIVAFYIPLVLMLFAYYKIFQIANKQEQKIMNMSIEMKRKLKKERKASKTLGTIMGVFLLCWLPFFIHNIISPFLKSPTPAVLVTVITWIGWVNSTINPILYSALNTVLKSAFRRMFCCKATEEDFYLNPYAYRPGNSEVEKKICLKLSCAEENGVV